jgi:hypothetical protein
VFNTREQLKGLNPDDRPRCWCEVGYATFPFDRLAQHLAHNGSKYLMNLTDSICKEPFSQYKIDQYVVFLIIHPAHAMFAEIMASRFGLAYTTQGGGFCHYPAGQSHGGILELDPAAFDVLQKQIMGDPAFLARAEADIQKMQEHTELYKNYAVLTKKMVDQTEAMEIMAARLKQKAEETKELVEELDRKFLEDTDKIAALLAYADDL